MHCLRRIWKAHTSSVYFDAMWKSSEKSIQSEQQQQQKNRGESPTKSLPGVCVCVL